MTTIESTTVSVMAPDALAERLAEAPPNAGRLDALAFDRLSATGCLDAVTAWERLVRHAHAGLIRALGALARDQGGGEDRQLVESELTAALAWAPSTAQYRLAEAEALTRLFPDALQQLSEGLVSLEQTRALAELTAGLDEHTARAVQQRVLSRMAGRSVNNTRQAIRRAITSIDPHAAAKRRKHERKRRHAELRPENDGIPNFGLRCFCVPRITAALRHQDRELRTVAISPAPTAPAACLVFVSACRSCSCLCEQCLRRIAVILVPCVLPHIGGRTHVC